MYLNVWVCLARFSTSPAVSCRFLCPKWARNLLEQRRQYLAIRLLQGLLRYRIQGGCVVRPGGVVRPFFSHLRDGISRGVIIRFQPGLFWL